MQIDFKNNLTQTGQGLVLDLVVTLPDGQKAVIPIASDRAPLLIDNEGIAHCTVISRLRGLVYEAEGRPTSEVLWGNYNTPV